MHVELSHVYLAEGLPDLRWCHHLATVACVQPDVTYLQPDVAPVLAYVAAVLSDVPAVQPNVAAVQPDVTAVLTHIASVHPDLACVLASEPSTAAGWSAAGSRWGRGRWGSSSRRHASEPSVQPT